jgi:hypothetical protein
MAREKRGKQRAVTPKIESSPSSDSEATEEASPIAHCTGKRKVVAKVPLPSRGCGRPNPQCGRTNLNYTGSSTRVLLWRATSCFKRYNPIGLSGNVPINHRTQDPTRYLTRRWVQRYKANAFYTIGSYITIIYKTSFVLTEEIITKQV